MNLAQIQSDIAILLGTLGTANFAFTPAQIADAIQWAQEQAARLVGLTYTEPNLPTKDVTGPWGEAMKGVTIPLDAIKVVRCEIGVVLPTITVTPDPANLVVPLNNFNVATQIATIGYGDWVDTPESYGFSSVFVMDGAGRGYGGKTANGLQTIDQSGNISSAMTLPGPFGSSYLFPAVDQDGHVFYAGILPWYSGAQIYVYKPSNGLGSDYQLLATIDETNSPNIDSVGLVIDPVSGDLLVWSSRGKVHRVTQEGVVTPNWLDLTPHFGPPPWNFYYGCVGGPYGDLYIGAYLSGAFTICSFNIGSGVLKGVQTLSDGPNVTYSLSGRFIVNPDGSLWFYGNWGFNYYNSEFKFVLSFPYGACEDGDAVSGTGHIATITGATFYNGDLWILDIDSTAKFRKVTPVPAGSVSQQFSATVTGTSDQRVTWDTTLGSIDETGLLTAPGAAGTGTVTATSTPMPSLSASAEVTVTIPTPA